MTAFASQFVKNNVILTVLFKWSVFVYENKLAIATNAFQMAHGPTRIPNQTPDVIWNVWYASPIFGTP